jgi:hypothetical protein
MKQEESKMSRCLTVWRIAAICLCVISVAFAKDGEKNVEDPMAPEDKAALTPVQIEKRIADIDKDLVRIDIQKKEVLKEQEELGIAATKLRVKTRDNDEVAVLRDRIRIVRAELRKLQKELNAKMDPDPEYQQHLKKSQVLGQRFGEINSRRSALMRERYDLQQDLSRTRLEPEKN